MDTSIMKNEVEIGIMGGTEESLHQHSASSDSASPTAPPPGCLAGDSAAPSPSQMSHPYALAQMGKAQLVVRYLHWLFITAETFNVGQYHRTATPNPSAEFFDNTNPGGRGFVAPQQRMRSPSCASGSLRTGADCYTGRDQLGQGPTVVDQEQCARENTETLLVESKCDDEDLIMSNDREAKATSLMQESRPRTDGYAELSSPILCNLCREQPLAALNVTSILPAASHLTSSSRPYSVTQYCLSTTIPIPIPIATSLPIAKYSSIETA
ncbi:hypothetical protein BU16DRAFT_557409 [Lophium mytilinum]|uniref:Uncharacterized protein n=1 Tax=Lophium mytilinum TaxID=390894 RepID=A0A6A6R3K6_9PEZI|nr:hypothetical protein BU16DRAFT_557409 [Lophium mytilinum]